MKKIIFIVLAVVLLAGGVYGYQTYRSIKTASAAQSSQKTATLELGSLSATISATGKVRSSQTATLNWQTSGIVELSWLELATQFRPVRNSPRWSRPPCLKVSSWRKPICSAPSNRWTT